MGIVGSNAVQPCAAGCVPICSELAKVRMFQEEADLASAVYQPFGQRNVPGYTEVTDPDELAKLDLTIEDVNPSDSQFRAGVFRKNGTNDYKVAFKGTTFTSMQDWKNNAQQGLTSRSDYYSRAKKIGRFASSNAGTADVGSVKYVGHSLGGGLASAAAHSSGTPATTFNSAGLHGFNRSWFNAPPIDAVRVKGELLTAVQGAIPFLAPDAVGTPYRINPPTNVASKIERANLNGWDALFPIRGAYKYTKAALARATELHGMEAVEAALDQQQAALEQKAAASGCSC